MRNYISKTKKSVLLASLLVGCVFITACSGFIGVKNNQRQAEYEEQIAKQGNVDPARPVVIKSTGAYLAGEKITVAEQLSPLLKKKVVYKPSRSVMLPDVAHWISEEFNIVVDLTGLQVNTTTQSTGTSMPGALNTSALPSAATALASNLSGGAGLPAPLGVSAPASNTAGVFQAPTNTQLARLPLQIPMNLNYEGTLNGLLDQLAQKTGVWWKFADGKAMFFRSESKTFYLPTIARSFKGSSTITTTSASVSGSSGSGGANVSGGASSSSGAESTSRYDVDLWKDIETTAKVVGKGAEVAINAAAGSITVTGSPAEVRHMETWVKTLSDQLSQQVQIDVNIYTVAVNSEENYSWNPSVIFKSAGNLGFNVTGVQTPAVIGGMTPFNIGASVINSSNYAGSTAALNALSTIGKVTEKLHQQAIAMNGQPTPVQLARQQSYLASSNSTTSANVGTTTSLTPGTFTVGFTAMFVPRIINGKIVLAMTMTNSALVSLKTVTSGSGSSQASIQTPDIDTSTFQNTVTLTPGDALLLTSLTKETGSNQNSGIFSPFFYLLGGGFDSTAGKQIMAIVVTAKVL